MSRDRRFWLGEETKQEAVPGGREAKGWGAQKEGSQRSTENRNWGEARGKDMLILKSLLYATHHHSSHLGLGSSYRTGLYHHGSKTYN